MVEKICPLPPPCALIDNNGMRIEFFYRYGWLYLNDFMSQCARAKYKVSEEVVYRFRWGGIEWDYLRPILTDGKVVVGVRMVIRNSTYLNPYYQLNDLLNNKELLKKYYDYKDDPQLKNGILEYDVKYEKLNTGYSIIFDLMDSKYYLDTDNGNLIAKWLG